jgi:hypothetical protein
MNRRTVAGIGAGIFAIATAVGIVAVGPLSTEAIDMCVTNWENGSQSGDSMTVCATPANLHVSNLGTHTENLVNGCQRSVNVSSTWSDCISSARVSALPPNYRVRWYQDTNYGAVLACRSTDGTTNVDLTGPANDLISSFRVEGGNC